MSNKNKVGRVSSKYLTREGFRNIRVHKLMSLASVTVLLACLVIIGSAFLIYVNINAVIAKVGEQNVIMVFSDDSTDEASLKALGEKIKAVPAVTDCQYISNADAFSGILNEMGESASVFEGEDGSFLPNAYKVTIGDMSQFDSTVSTIRQMDSVMSIRENSELAGKLVTIKTAIGYLFGSMVIVLFVVALFIIANTVRITMFSRKLEISIMKAVGATNSFIRWPFIIEGMVLGVIAAVLAFGVLSGFYALAGNVFAELFNLLNGHIVPYGKYMWYILTAYLFIGIFTGVFGSSISLGKYLKEHGKVVEND